MLQLAIVKILPLTLPGVYSYGPLPASDRTESPWIQTRVELPSYKKLHCYASASSNFKLEKALDSSSPGNRLAPEHRADHGPPLECDEYGHRNWVKQSTDPRLLESQSR